MTQYNTISIYGSHDASVTFLDKSGAIRVYEYERFVKKRYAMFSTSFDNRIGMGSNDLERRSFLTLIKSNLQNEDIRNVLYSELNQQDISLLKDFFPNATFKKVGHHFSHASSGYFSSNFDKSLIFSVDGGGTDNNVQNTTKAYIGIDSKITEIECVNFDFGNPYSAIGYLISEIKAGVEGDECMHSLVYAGKIMGLCAYGKIRKEWVEHFFSYYESNNLRKLCENISVPFGSNTTKGDLSYDLAATSQYVFEKKMDDFIIPYIEKYNVNVTIVGGCALNVLYNQKLYEFLEKRNLKLHVPPNPNDCGQSYGMFLSEFPSLGSTEVVYGGIELLDNDNFEEYLRQYKYEDCTYSKIVDHLNDGKILGVINGNSEVGPRALGNRSIICNPSFPNMKDTLNKKVKFREWYRPFAPVCRIEDKDIYFNNATESKYMSYAPTVKDGFKDNLKSIVHEDGTTRLQTVKKDDHDFFYNILSEINNRNEVAVILNTSFNVRGFPILTTLEDAFYVLDNTELDFLVVNNKIFRKK